MSETPSHLSNSPGASEQGRPYAPVPLGAAGQASQPPKKLFKSPFSPEKTGQTVYPAQPVQTVQSVQSASYVSSDASPTTEPSVDWSGNPFKRGDSLKHVALWSQASIQRDVSAAKYISRPRIPTQNVNAPTYSGDPFTPPQPQPAVMSPALDRSVLNSLPVVKPQMPMPGVVPQPQWGQQAQSVIQGPQVSQMPPQQKIDDEKLSKRGKKSSRRAKRQAKLISTVSPTPFKHSGRELLMLALLLVGYLFTVVLNVSSLMNDYAIFSYARDGVQQLLAVKNQASAMKAHITNLDPNMLNQMQGELAKARDDFSHLHDKLQQNTNFNAIGGTLPQYTNTLLALCKIGSDAADIGQAAVKLAIVYAPALHGSLLADSSKAQPILTPTSLAQTKSTLDYMLPRLRDIQSQLPLVALDSLPLSVSQRDQIDQILQYVPIVVTDATQLDNLMSAVGWVLGVGQPRTFLVQTLDRAELRPTGGFTGQYGELSLNGARMAPFKLQNIGLLEDPTDGTSNVQGNLAPQTYRSWWPVANWGLRDSNLSADFPTSAQIAIAQYKAEFKHQVDGLMVFSPFLVARVLAATGPIYIPEYKETVTSQNLEGLLHFYQLDNVGIRKEEIVEHQDNSQIARKLFTARVLTDLENSMRHASISVLIGIGHEMLHALKTRDLQVYVTNSQIENLLMQYGAAATIDRSTTHDGLFVVQANVSANKASQYVQTILHDTVTLDAKGGATHMLQMRLVYHQVGQVYGPDTYHDYVRIYVPPSSQFLWGNGFEQIGQPLCSAPAGFGACSTYDPYGDGDLMCPATQSDPYVETAQLPNFDAYIGLNHPLNKEGPPTNMTSDEAQRAMYAGWVLIPKNCTLTVSLSWYVPPMGNAPYSLLVQRQSGTYPLVDVTILPAPGACGTLHSSGKHFDAVLERDGTYSIQGDNTEQGGSSGCYVQPGV